MGRHVFSGSGSALPGRQLPHRCRRQYLDSTTGAGGGLRGLVSQVAWGKAQLNSPCVARCVQQVRRQLWKQHQAFRCLDRAQSNNLERKFQINSQFSESKGRFCFRLGHSATCLGHFRRTGFLLRRLWLVAYACRLAPMGVGWVATATTWYLAAAWAYTVHQTMKQAGSVRLCNQCLASNFCHVRGRVPAFT